MVRLLAHLCDGGESCGDYVAVQVAIGHFQLGGLPRLHCDDGTAVAEQIGAVGVVGRAEVFR